MTGLEIQDLFVRPVSCREKMFSGGVLKNSRTRMSGS